MEEANYSETQDSQMDENTPEYLPQLQAELDSIDLSFTTARKLLATEITRVKGGISAKDPKIFIEAHNMTPIKVSVFVLLPTKEHPKFNFVGKLLGPGGNSLKRLQSDSQTKMAIQGRGSVRDKDKEEEQRQSGEPKYHHLKEDLHLKIEAYAPAEEAYARIASAIREVQPFLIPEIHDAISQGQMTQMSSGGRGRGRGDGRRGGRGESHGRPVSYYDREMAPASRGYDDYRGRDPYASSAADAYDRAEPRSQPREYYDSYSQPRSIESRRETYGEYPTSRQASWAGQGNGYGKSAAPRGGRGSDRSHPYGRGGRPAAY